MVFFYNRYFIGCSSIYILVFISIIRYLKIKNPINNDNGPKYGLAIIGIAGSCLNGLFWALMPLFGWSEYAPEGAMISCCIEWNKRTLSVMSYNISITIFVYLIPLALLIFTNAHILYIVSTLLLIMNFFFEFLNTFKIKTSRKKFLDRQTDSKESQQVLSEMKVSIRLSVLISKFLRTNKSLG
jgi:hypothetical protein